MIIEVSIVSSTTGGTSMTDAYDRQTTIERIVNAMALAIREHVSPGQISTLKFRARKPSMKRGILVNVLRAEVRLGNINDLSRPQMIDKLGADVPELVKARVPANHQCSLIVAVRNR